MGNSTSTTKAQPFFTAVSELRKRAREHMTDGAVTESYGGNTETACKVLNEEVPWAPMWVTTRFGAVSKKVQNFVYTPSAGSGKYYDQAELWPVAK